jgi:pimeloyl-ACP methyl ester carboxylesterase
MRIGGSHEVGIIAWTCAREIPGNGQKFKEKSPHSIGVMVDDLRSDWLRDKSSEPQIILSMSLGTMITTDWLSRYPDDFSAAILMNGSLKGYSPLTKRLRFNLYPSIARLLVSSDIAKIEKSILSLVSNRHAADTRLLDKWIKIQQQRPVSRANAIRQLLSAAKYTPPTSRPTQAPILIINGLMDRLVHPDCSASIAQRWGVPLVSHPTAGHDITLDEPEWVIEQLKTWLQKELQS